MNKEEVLTVGIIGFGNVNQEVARQLLAAGKGKVRWILDRTPEKQKKLELINKIAQIQGESPQIITSVEELVNVEKVDAVIESTGDIDAVNFLRKIRACGIKR
ncbi:MAG: Homoserine dehydrogenase, binding domain [Candidatus Brocadiaceae bacterium]|nr:Homoserine dehydrogenase, binding domain [Candidatus Brocadiaceae bacterium]